MGANSKIQWCHHTGGPWLGCTEVSPGCAECYARDLLEARLAPIVRKAYRFAGFDDCATRPIWGNKAPRVLTKGFWKEARRLNRKAMDRVCSKGHAYPATYANLLHGKCYSCGERWEQMPNVRPRMFPSMIDWLDDMPAGIIDQEGNWLDRDTVFADFVAVIAECQNLDWLLLTKRPENFEPRMTSAVELLGKREDEAFVFADCWLSGNKAAEFLPSNVWLGVSVEDQKRADERIPILLQTPATIRFLSCEPLLGPLDLELIPYVSRSYDTPEIQDRHLDWVIIGGESGPKARVCNVDWIDDIRRQCVEANVPVFVKQLGAVPVTENANRFEWPDDAKLYEGKPSDHGFAFAYIKLRDRKGGDPNEWPEDLRIREFPKTRAEIPA